MTAHRYWRLFIFENAGQSYTDIAEISMASSTGGANLCTGGTAASSSSYNSSFLPGNAFDGNPSTSWATSDGSASNSWISYDFGSAVDIAEVKITARNDANDTSWPTYMALQSSDDNSNWTNVCYFVASLSEGSTQTFEVYTGSVLDAHRYWRVFILTNAGQSGYTDIAEIEMRTTSGGANLCTGGSAASSSSYNSSYLPANAFDGNPSTSWASVNGSPLNQWVSYDFGSAKSVGYLTLAARNDTSDNSWPALVELQFSDDGASWSLGAPLFFSLSEGLSSTVAVSSSSIFTPMVVGATTSGGSSITIPSATGPGCVTFIAMVNNNEANYWTVPSGWTSLTSSTSQYIVIYRAYQSGYPTTVSIAPGYYASVASAVTYLGLDTSNPVDTHNCCIIRNGMGGKIRAPSVSPSFTNDRLLCVYFVSSWGGWSSATVPSDLSLIISRSDGPGILFADKPLADNTPTPCYDLVTSRTVSDNFGMQIALKPSTATAATRIPSITFAGVDASNSVSPYVPPLDYFQIQENDLVVVVGAIGEAESTTTPPTGYTLLQTTAKIVAFAHIFTSGDTTVPSFPGAGYFTTWATYVFRNTIAGGASPGVDCSSIASGTSPLTTISVTPSGSDDLLLVVFFENGIDSIYWTTIPSGLIIDYNINFGPSMLIGWEQPSPVPAGTYSAGFSVADNVVGLEIAVKLGAGIPGSGGSVLIGPMITLIM